MSDDTGDWRMDEGVWRGKGTGSHSDKHYSDRHHSDKHHSDICYFHNNDNNNHWCSEGGAEPRAAFGRTPECKANSEASIMGDRSVRAPEIVVQGLTIHGTHGIHPLLKPVSYTHLTLPTKRIV